MKRTFIYAGLALYAMAMATNVQARDIGVLLLPVHQGKFTSSVLYENTKLKDDFDSRGRVDFKSQLVGAVFSYGLTDQVAVVLKGGTLLEPQAEARGSEWKSRAGYLYGLDLYNEVFPATPGWRPGIQLSGGITGFQVPFDRVVSGGVVTLIDQRQTGFDYHGTLAAVYKWSKVTPFVGLRANGSYVSWKDNRPSPGAVSEITGHARGHISLVAGLPVNVTNEIQIFVVGRFVSETAITAGITVATF